MSTHSNISSVTLTAGVAQQIVGPNINRYELTLQVTGASPVTFGFGSAPAGPGMGLTLDPPATVGGQGGSRIWAMSALDDRLSDHMPYQSIWALSGGSSTAIVVESFP